MLLVKVAMAMVGHRFDITQHPFCKRSHSVSSYSKKFLLSRDLIHEIALRAHFSLQNENSPRSPSSRYVFSRMLTTPIGISIHTILYSRMSLTSLQNLTNDNISQNEEDPRSQQNEFGLEQVHNYQKQKKKVALSARSH